MENLQNKNVLFFLSKIDENPFTACNYTYKNMNTHYMKNLVINL